MGIIKYILRDELGRIERGDLEGETLTVAIDPTQRLSFNLHESEALGIKRAGKALELMLIDGRSIVIEGFFDCVGGQAQLYFSTDNVLHEIRVDVLADGTVEANRGPTAQAGASNLSDRLIHDTAANLAIAAPATPKIDAELPECDPFVESSAGAPIVIDGKSAPGHAMRVSLGGHSADVMLLEDGKWEARLPLEVIELGLYSSEMTAVSTDSAGNNYPATQPVIVHREADRCAIYVVEQPKQEATPQPEVAPQPEPVAETVQTPAPLPQANSGIEFAGQAEPGSSVRVQFSGKDYPATIDAAGNWIGVIPRDDITPGTYSADVCVIATDPQGRSAQLTQTLEIDTNAPNGPVVDQLNAA